MALLTGMTEDGREVPVQVDATGRLVAEGLPGPPGPVGPTGPVGPAGLPVEYIAGSWTPAYSPDRGTWTYTVAVGRYVKIGGMIHLAFYIDAKLIEIKSPNSAVYVTNLPYASEHFTNGATGGTSFWNESIVGWLRGTSTGITWKSSAVGTLNNGYCTRENWPDGVSVKHAGSFVILT